MSPGLPGKRRAVPSGIIDSSKAVAVLDIGSNSVRLVVYEHHLRALTPVFNEKAACSLGRGVAQTGDIAQENLAMALSAIKRFALVVRLLNVEHIHILATSAVREAGNGARFMEAVEHYMGVSGHVLTGEEEAHFAALGVLSGMPDFSGVVGDLGGGSLELSRLRSGTDTLGETLELGVIRLQDDSALSAVKSYDIAKKRLKKSKVLTDSSTDTFCAIGGTWRALAKLMQMQTDYPMHIIQDYQVRADELAELCKRLVMGNTDEPFLDQINRSRAGLLPYGAAVLSGIIERGGFKKILFSSLGVREGYLYARLSKKQADANPLLQSAAEMCRLRSRSPRHARDLIGFTGEFLSALGEKESKGQRILREAACLLSDIGWRGHKDYRGEQSVDLVAYSALIGLDHAGRGFLAETLAVRYLGLKHQSSSQSLSSLVSAKHLFRARMLGTMLRVAYALSGAMPQLLPRLKFKGKEKKVQMVLPADLSFLQSARLRSRLSQLARHAEIELSVIVSD